MKKILITTGYLLFFLGAAIWLMPKTNLYYQAELLLKESEVVIDGEHLKESGFSLQIMQPTLYVKQVESAKADKVCVTSLGLYNSVTMKRVVLDEAFGSIVPRHVDALTLTYSLLHPLSLIVDAKGEFGTAEGEIRLDARQLTMMLHPSKMMETRFASTLKRLNKEEEGGYRYAASF